MNRAPTNSRRSVIGRRAFVAGLSSLAALPLTGLGAGRAGPLSTDTAADRLHETFFKTFSLTDAQEARLGREMEKSMIGLSGGPYLNRLMQAALMEFAQPLFQAAQKKLFTWNITLIDNETPGAWVLPGGRMGLHKGLLRYTATPDQLATVIAHEIGHADLSHLTAIMRRPAFSHSLQKSTVEALLLDAAEKNPAGILARRILRDLNAPIYKAITRGYGPALEQQADDHIALVFRQTGHDLTAGAEIFGTIERLIPPDRTGRNCLFNGHGTAVPRMARLAGQDPTIGPSSILPANRGFERLKATFPTRTHYRLHPLNDATDISFGTPPDTSENAGP